VGRPTHKPLAWYKGFLYQAASWKTACYVVAQVEFHAGELFPRLGFIVTNTQLRNRAVVRFYNKRGTAEQWIKEGKQAVKITRLSCHRFRGNEVRLWLSILAYNLGNLWRRLGLPGGIDDWSLTSLQQRLIKTGGRLVKHARYYWLLLAEGHLTRGSLRCCGGSRCCRFQRANNWLRCGKRSAETEGGGSRVPEIAEEWSRLCGEAAMARHRALFIRECGFGVAKSPMSSTIASDSRLKKGDSR